MHTSNSIITKQCIASTTKPTKEKAAMTNKSCRPIETSHVHPTIPSREIDIGTIERAEIMIQRADVRSHSIADDWVCH
jgi:hypothetical protein